ncbi:MAG: hypothetical protein JXA08_01735 [Methanomicrobiaceae archaeon]|nr:hypothetical protein [Methanomicrobiaceae archaeon]
MLISHFLYIPVVLACYRYPRDGVVVSAAIALLYFAAVILLLPPLLPETLVTSGRAAMFVLIGGVISFLSLRLQAKEKQ